MNVGSHDTLLQHTPRTAGPPDCQVLVVGAGPTGLVLAADLLARGIRTRIIDKGDGVALQTRAIGIHARTLEVLDMMGLAERFTERGQVVRHLRFYSEGRCLASLEFARSGSRFGFLLDLPQDETERLLRARVAELGGVVEQGTELTGLAAGGDAVTATVRGARGPGRRRSPPATWSAVTARTAGSGSELGLTFHGHPYPQDWLLADVLLDWDLREDAVHAFFRPDGLPADLLPDARAPVAADAALRREPGGQAPTLEEIQELTDQRAPRPVTVSDPTWLANFRCHRRSASGYRRGRVLLAGDAVHIHTPAGGQGVNTGITDAHNLGWKLALVASGRAPDALLDSYGTERRPVAEQVLKLTHALVHYGTMNHPIKRRVRDIVVPALGRSAVIQRRAARRISQVSVAYPPGPLARRDRGRGDAESRPAHARPPGLRGQPGHHAAQRPARWPARAGGSRGQRASVLSDPGLRPYRQGPRRRHGRSQPPPQDSQRWHGAGRPGPAGRPRGGAGKAGRHAVGDGLPT